MSRMRCYKRLDTKVKNFHLQHAYIEKQWKSIMPKCVLCEKAQKVCNMSLVVGSEQGGKHSKPFPSAENAVICVA